jgi:hypothetical protein
MIKNKFLKIFVGLLPITLFRAKIITFKKDG